MTQPAPKTLRCAIYTRVSTEYGLEQEFNSLDAQREAAEAFIKSQAHEGWRLLRDHYDDGGFSGGSMDRPALQKLLAAIREHRIDIVVVYKVDRLTRSLADFAKLVELFDAHGVSFVSVTQAFNTTNSMGRLTLNVLLSFAQFEREVTGERIRDKVAASKRKGLRMGGPTPLGYDVRDKKLVINPEEAERVRLIFKRYSELGSLTETLRDLHKRNVLTKMVHRKDGSTRGGGRFGRGALHNLLRNRAYVGEVVHKDKHFPGIHEPILDRALFDSVQRLLAANGHAHAQRRRRMTSAFLLTGKIFDDRGNRMTPATANKAGARYRYYITRVMAEGRNETAGSVRRVSAPDIEAAVVAALRPNVDVSPGQAESAEKLPDRQIVYQRLASVTVRSDHLEIRTLELDEGSPETMRIPWSSHNTSRKRAIIAPNGQDSQRPIRSETRARLVEAIAKGRRWLEELASGRMKSTDGIAAREGCSDRSVRMQVCLAFLSPDIVRGAVEGRLSRKMGVVTLAHRGPEWEYVG